MADRIPVWMRQSVDSTLFGDAHVIGSWLADRSGLPGMRDGPADALRHVTRAALVGLEGGKGQLLAVRELVGMLSSDNRSGMDNYNNAVGLQIGHWVRTRMTDLSPAEQRGQVVRLSMELLQKSLQHNAPNTLDGWQAMPGKDGYMTRPEPIFLSNGQTIPSIALYPPQEWLPPEAVEQRDAWPDAERKWMDALEAQARQRLCEAAESCEQELLCPRTPAAPSRSPHGRG